MKLRILSAVLLSLAMAPAVSAAVIMLDIDSTQGGTSLITQEGFSSYDATQTTNGEGSIDVDGVTVTFFGGLGGSRNRATGGGGGTYDALLRDFLFKDGAGAGVGVRLTGLPLGTYDVQSFHFDSGAGITGTIQAEVRNPGGASTIVADAVPFSTEPVSYQITVDDEGEVIELIFREDDDLNRSRLNGLIIQPVPEPGAAVMTLAVAGLVMRRRRNR